MAQTPDTTRPALAGPGSTPRALVAPDGNRLAYESFEADGPVGLVFLHGGGQSRHSWRRAAREFQARGWPCLIYDARGHGDSEWIASGDYRPHGFARDALALLDHWRRPAILVGASLGGITALLAAGEPNPWVAGLVMVDTAPRLNVEEIHRLIGFLDAGDGFESPAAAAAHVNGYFPGSDVSPEAAERGLRRATDGRWYWNWDARVVRGERTSLAIPYEAELRDCARRLRVPLLLVRAGASAIVTDAAEADLRECAPALEVVVLPDAHHMLSGADNLRFVQVAAPFLTRVRDYEGARRMIPSPRTHGELTVGDVLRRAVREHGANEAIVIGERRLTYAQLLAEARRWARALHAHGLRHGDHVGVLMPNCLEYLLLFYGCALLGARPVHLNSRYKRADLAYVLQDSDVKALFISGRQHEYFDYAAMLREIAPACAQWRKGTPLALAEAPALASIVYLHAPAPHAWWTQEDFLAGAERVAQPEERVTPDDIALMMYTSGTTANPKACLLSHRALELAGLGLAMRYHMTASDRFWDPLPFFHMSTMLPLATCRRAGATFIAQEHFEPAASLAEIERERATVIFPSFPTLTLAMFEHREFSPARMQTVRIVNNVGPPDLLRRFAATLPSAVHASAYGLTEGGGVIAFNDLDDTPDELATTCGRPYDIDGAAVRIVDPDTLRELPQGEAGEIQLRGPTMFSGYYKDAAKTAATLLPDGWLRTGDRGSLDARGRIRYLGRIKDMLKVGGENVAAIEIESYLCTHPAVKVAQVVGVPDERLVEVAAAFVELKDGATLTAEEVVRYCKGRIASFKIPRYVYFVREWPMSATKVQKFRLRELVAAADRLDPAQVA